MAQQYRFTSKIDGEEVIITANSISEARQQMRMRDAQKTGSRAGTLDPNTLRLQQRSADTRLTGMQEERERAARLAGLGQQFTALNEMEPGTGPGAISTLPIVGGLFRNAPTQQMAQINAEITPTMRQPGSGAVSDFDARMFQMATMNIDKSPAVNAAIARGYQNLAARNAERASAAESWVVDPRNSGTLIGFDDVWRRYSQDVPIFDPRSNPMAPSVNQNAMSFADWMQRTGGGRRSMNPTRSPGRGATPGLTTRVFEPPPMPGRRGPVRTQRQQELDEILSRYPATRVD